MPQRAGHWWHTLFVMIVWAFAVPGAAAASAGVNVRSPNGVSPAPAAAPATPVTCRKRRRVSVNVDRMFIASASELPFRHCELLYDHRLYRTAIADQVTDAT